MKPLIRLIALACLLCGSAFCGFSHEWRGIVPLHSTRAEVIKVLGNPTHGLWNDSEVFESESETVKIEWIDPACVRRYPIAPDTEVRLTDVVLSVTLFPKKRIAVETLQLNSKPGIATVGCNPNGPCTFCGEDFCVTSDKPGVTRVYFSATADELKAWSREHPACKPSARAATQQIVGRERRERVSHHNWSGDT
jgi:hypothetical protein